MVLAGEWNDAMSAILEWLAQLARNMIRGQLERFSSTRTCFLNKRASCTDRLLCQLGENGSNDY